MQPARQLGGCTYFLGVCKISDLPTPRINLSSTPERTKEDNPWITGFLTPVCTVRCNSVIAPTTARVGASIIRQWNDPLEALAWMSKTFWPDEGKWIGFLSYDLGRLFEKVPSRAADDLVLPLFVFTYCRPVGDRPPGARRKLWIERCGTDIRFYPERIRIGGAAGAGIYPGRGCVSGELGAAVHGRAEIASGGDLSAAGSRVAGGVRGVPGIRGFRDYFEFAGAIFAGDAGSDESSRGRSRARGRWRREWTRFCAIRSRTRRN